ncbi:hypothetical protein [Aneurinibacillus terranovensis]|uniref:hypothetical protein n=1 Tax=Aneurinibacillus terranovensis TaxID=278991 RepID=UPI00040C27C6|nr:hypothetical protein [Aneurinibacillus terranovensis]
MDDANKKRACSIIFALLSFLFISACSYPRDQLVENSVPPLQQIKMVQDAVDSFQKDTQVLPIETRDASTPPFERYPVDFSKLKPKYIPYVPGIAFEAGENYMFILVNAETKPEVRLVDLTVSQKVQTVQEQVTRYFADKKRFPFGKKIADGYYDIDFSKLGTPAAMVHDAANDQELPLIMTERGIVGVDYSIDVNLALKSRKQKTKIAPSEDIRSILVDSSPLAPVKSFPYHLVNGEPQLAKENR